MARDNPNPSRFHSLALGKYNNFQARTDGLIAEADVTPDVSLYSLLYANNSSNYSITGFDNGSEGQIIYVVNVGSDLSFTRSSTMLVTDSSNLIKNDSISFINHASAWYELSRSHSAAVDVRTVAAGDATPTVQNTKTLIFNSAGALAVTNFDDGYEGQIITAVNKGAGAVTLTNDVTKLVISGSAANYALAASGAVILVKAAGVWHLASSTNPGALA